MFEDGVLKRGDFPDYINQFRTDKIKPFVDLGEIEVPVRVKKEAVVEMMLLSSVDKRDATVIKRLLDAPKKYRSGDYFPLDGNYSTQRPPQSDDNLFSYGYEDDENTLYLSFNKDFESIRKLILDHCKKKKLSCEESLIKGSDGMQRQIAITYA
jgi:hypothetical protein